MQQQQPPTKTHPPLHLVKHVLANPLFEQHARYVLFVSSYLMKPRGGHTRLFHTSFQLTLSTRTRTRTRTHATKVVFEAVRASVGGAGALRRRPRVLPHRHQEGVSGAREISRLRQRSHRACRLEASRDQPPVRQEQRLPHSSRRLRSHVHTTTPSH